MRKATLLCLLLSWPVFFFANPVRALPPAQQTVEVRDDEFEREVIARLTEISPEAVLVFRQATAEWDAGNPEAARAGFEVVLGLETGFHDTLPRLARVEQNMPS